MKAKQVYNPEFDYICGYIGGFDDIPTKQDKFKPIVPKTITYIDENGEEQKLEGEFYASNNKAKDNLKKFEARFTDCINEMLNENHPYKNPIQLEVIMNVKMSEKRLKNVDADNIAKCVLDIMNGKVFEDDSQVRSLYVYKHVIQDELVPQLSGIIVGVRIIDNKPSLLSEIKFYDFIEISDQEYEEAMSKKK
ncbi:RusA family crossover junction endodeoxyribonuclease [Flavobacterium sp. NG2]|uniref:RusA family crossover junction endodeoxyribonuclease n=1 Tax=Flavobacterium sp. NG2 TaxID=3097547 RepID=UPI002A83E1FE|nr:RusA family crossover junction endodeoxyribonuclease [Flavobacterium sp. NG2]WPR71477.1 RusA family crossover junction endodeoxyribonuclease [Flavobacterium sp. NG2]